MEGYTKGTFLWYTPIRWCWIKHPDLEAHGSLTRLHRGYHDGDYLTLSYEAPGWHRLAQNCRGALLPPSSPDHQHHTKISRLVSTTKLETGILQCKAWVCFELCEKISFLLMTLLLCLNKKYIWSGYWTNRSPSSLPLQHSIMSHRPDLTFWELWLTPRYGHFWALTNQVSLFW